MLDFRLRVFFTVAKMLNFTKAAASLDISQPAVTKHIKELEQSYGVPLFDRQPNAMALTEAGEILLRHATGIMEQYDLLQFDINALQHPVTGTLRIGATPTIARYRLPELVAGFRAKFPKVKVGITVSDSQSLQSQLTDSKLDIAFIATDDKIFPYQLLPFLHDDILLVCSQNNSVQKRPATGVNDLMKLPFLVQEDDPDTTNTVTKYLQNAGVPVDKMQVDFRLPDTETVKNFLVHSQAFAFLPHYSVAGQLANGTLRQVQVDGLTPSISYHIATRDQEHSPALAALLHHINVH